MPYESVGTKELLEIQKQEYECNINMKVSDHQDEHFGRIIIILTSLISKDKVYKAMNTKTRARGKSERNPKSI